MGCQTLGECSIVPFCSVQVQPWKVTTVVMAITEPTLAMWPTWQAKAHILPEANMLCYTQASVHRTVHLVIVLCLTSTHAAIRTELYREKLRSRAPARGTDPLGSGCTPAHTLMSGIQTHHHR
jgi:hypothetical protein